MSHSEASTNDSRVMAARRHALNAFAIDQIVEKKMPNDAAAAAAAVMPVRVGINRHGRLPRTIPAINFRRRE